MTSRYIPLLLLTSFAAGCTGAVGDREPGSSLLGGGTLAVDPYHETVFTLRSASYAPEDATPAPEDLHHTLYGIDPDRHQATAMADLDGEDLGQIVFTRDQILVTSLREGDQIVRRFDAQDLTSAGEATLPQEALLFKASPSLRALLAEKVIDEGGTSLARTDTLARSALIPEGLSTDWRWMNTRDDLLTVTALDATEDAPASLRLSVAPVTLGDDASAAPTLGEASFEVTLPADGQTPVSAWFYTYVSADDRAVVLPLNATASTEAYADALSECEGEEALNRLLVVDLAQGTTHIVSGIHPSLAFTPDASAVVGYGYRCAVADDGSVERLPSLRVVDLATQAVEELEIPDATNAQFFVTREGHFVVVDTLDSGENLLLLDLDTGATTQMQGPQVDLANPMVSRLGHPELYLVDEGLYRLDYEAGTVEALPLSFTPADINILPQRDTLVLLDDEGGEVVFYDPSASAVIASASVPHP